MDQHLIVKTFQELDVKIYGTYEEPLFRAKDIAELLDLRNIRKTIQDMDDDCKITLNYNTVTNSDGILDNENSENESSSSRITPGNPNYNFLTEKGLYEVLYISRKPLAKTFRNWVYNVIKEIRLNGEYKLQTQLQEQLKEQQQQLDLFKQIEQDTAIKHHNHLIDLLDKKLVVYFGRVTPIKEGSFILKIGETGDIRERSRSHKVTYGSFTLLYAVEVARSKLFEHFLHDYPIIKEHRYNEPINGQVSKEFFKIDDGLPFDKVMDICQRNIKDFQNLPTEVLINHENNLVHMRELSLKERTLDLIQNCIQTDTTVDELCDFFVTFNSRLGATNNSSNVDNDQLPRYTEYTENELPEQSTSNHVNGPRVQKIDPCDFNNIIETYEGYTDVVRKHTVIMSICALKKAVSNNTEYKGFRWNAVPRDQDVQQVYTIAETVKNRQPNTGPIARLNYPKTEIMEVYENQKKAMEQLGFSSSSRAALSIAISKGTESKGSFWLPWDDCDDFMKESFIKKHGEPKLAPDYLYQKICVDNRRVVAKYTNKSEIAKKCKMGANTVARVLETGENYKGFVFTRIEN